MLIFFIRLKDTDSVDHSSIIISILLKPVNLLWSNNMKTFLFLISLSLSVHAGLSFNQISNPIREVANPVFVNGKIVYLDSSNNIWINQGSANSDSQPTFDSKAFSTFNFVKSDSVIYFVNKADGNSLWSTNGESFNKLSDLNYSYISNYNGNVVFGKLNDSSTFAVINDGIVMQYAIEPLSFAIDQNNTTSPSVCFFDTNRLIVKAYPELSTNAQYHYYNSGNVSLLDFGQSTYPVAFVLNHNNECYYKYYNSENDKLYHFKVNETGIVKPIVNPEDSGYFDELFVFDNQILLFLKDEYGSKDLEIYTLPSDSEVPEPLFTIEESFFKISSYWATPKYLYIYSNTGCFPLKSTTKCTPQPPDPYKLYIYDTSYNLVNKIIDDTFGYIRLENIEGKDFLIKGNYQADSLLELKDGKKGQVVSDIKVAMLDIIGGDSGEYYIHGQDKTTNSIGIYKASEQAVISNQLTGLWISDQWQSQGLSIHTGTRADSSQYVFVSFYIYRDGQPFWLAGSDELNTGMSSQTINMAEYKGQSFLSNDPNQDFEQINFGTITLTPMGCNQLQVQISPVDEQSIQLDMGRIVNTEFSNVCAD